jgi:hypothetical protein
VTEMLTVLLRAPQTHDAATHQTRCDQPQKIGLRIKQWRVG